MSIKSFILTFYLCGIFLYGNSFAQMENELEPVKKEINSNPKFDIGVGLGCDYAGVIGVKLAYAPIPYFSVFTSGGFAMFDFAYNVGACYHIIPKTSQNLIRPHIKAMYGYNEIIVLFDERKYNKLYYGFTPGIGVEYRFKKNRNRGIDFDINFPFKSENYDEDIMTIEQDPSVDLKKYLPIAFAIGYHWEF